MFKILSRYIKIWWMLTRNSFTIILGQRNSLLIFLFGKILRFVFFITFLFFLISGSKGLVGYDTNQIIFFFLTFSLISTTSQFIFREVYRFRSKITKGDFDLTLIKPVNPLFISIMGGADFIDLITLPPLIYLTFHYGALLDPNLIQVILYLFLILNSLVISAAFYILIISLGIITLEMDHTLLMFRDLETLGRFPIDIYKQPIRGILTYLVPIGIMMSVPVKALIGLVSFSGALGFLIFGILVFMLSLRFWNFALKRYTSAA